MLTPTWLNDFLVAATGLISLYFAGRLLVARTHHRRIHVEVNVAELVMGVAMAGMLRPSLNLLPNGLWEGVFACLALWFVVQNVRFVSRRGFVGGDVIVRYHRVHYPLHVVILCAFAVWQLDSLDRLHPTRVVVDPVDADLVTTPPIASNGAFPVTRVSTPSAHRDRLDEWLTPRLESSCLIAMSITMALLLVLML